MPVSCDIGNAGTVSAPETRCGFPAGLPRHVAHRPGGCPVSRWFGELGLDGSCRSNSPHASFITGPEEARFRLESCHRLFILHDDTVVCDMHPMASLFRRIGPGLITVCVVVGPGSLLTSSKVGAQYGYQLLWVLLLAVVLMLVYMSLGARLGVMADAPPGELIRRRFGSWLTTLIGVAVFIIAATFQFANNLGVLAAVDSWSSEWNLLPIGKVGVLIALNLGATAFLLGSRSFYKPLERIMTVFVAMMLVAFLINMCFAQPRWSEVLGGLIPEPDLLLGDSADWVTIIAWVGTTFSVAIAYFQAYLVRQKGWTRSDLASGMLDVAVAATLLGLITLMITVTAAAALKGNDLKNISAVAAQLEPTFGVWGKRLFCIGLFSAAYSSYLVNSSIGGFLLADGMQLGTSTEDRWPRRFAVAVLLIGMVVAIYIALTGGDIVPAILFAQAITVVLAPLLGIVILSLTNSKSIMGKHTNGWLLNTLAGFGLLMLFVLSGYILTQKVIPTVSNWVATSSDTVQGN